MRKTGTQNHTRRDDADLAAIQVKIPVDLKAEFIAAIHPRPMVAVIEELIRVYVNHDQAVGADIEQDAAIFPPKSVTRITARIERVVEGGEA